MRTFYYKTRWWLGLAAALFLALGPAIAPVLSASSRGHTIEICTAFGLIKQAVAGDFVAPGQEEPTHRDGSGHCLLCSLRQIALLPPSSPALPLPSGLYLAAAAAWEFLPAALLFSASYNSRAPPFTS